MKRAMGKTKKIVPIPANTIDKVREDLGADGVKLYEITELPKEFVGKDLIHPDVCSKCDTFVACVSGSHVDGREYMFIAGLRKDHEDGYQVTDIDPIGMVYDLEIQSPAPSGIALFHGNFQGRTEIDYSNTTITVDSLKQQLGDEMMTFANAPKRFTNAIHYVANKYKSSVDNS